MTKPRVNSQFVIATLAEFVRVWDLGEDASLHLETTKGHATMAFNCKLGPPSAPHPNPTFPPPTPPPWPRHHRGPAQREKNRQRAARYQASKRDAAVAAATSSSLPTSVSLVTVTNSTPSTTTLVSTLYQRWLPQLSPLAKLCPMQLQLLIQQLYPVNSSLLLYQSCKDCLMNYLNLNVISANTLGNGNVICTAGLGNTERRSIGFGIVFVVVRHFPTKLPLENIHVFCIRWGCPTLDDQNWQNCNSVL